LCGSPLISIIFCCGFLEGRRRCWLCLVALLDRVYGTHYSSFFQTQHCDQREKSGSRVSLISNRTASAFQSLNDSAIFQRNGKEQQQEEERTQKEIKISASFSSTGKKMNIGGFQRQRHCAAFPISDVRKSEAVNVSLVILEERNNNRNDIGVGVGGR